VPHARGLKFAYAAPAGGSGAVAFTKARAAPISPGLLVRDQAERTRLAGALKPGMGLTHHGVAMPAAALYGSNQLTRRRSVLLRTPPSGPPAADEPAGKYK
jgi:hypothetical protein